MTQLNELNERIAKCERVLQSNPGSQIFAALAEAYRKRGDLELAFQVCQKGLRNHPDYGSAHMVMAKVNLDRGMYDWAEMEATRAGKLGVNLSALELLRAEILLYRGERERAIAHLEKLNRADPTNNQIEELLKAALKTPTKSGNRTGRGMTVSGAPTIQDPISPFGRPVSVGANPLGVRRGLTSFEIIGKICAHEFIAGAVEFNSEGQVLAATWKSERPSDDWLVGAHQFFETVWDVCDRVGIGEFRTIFVETKSGLLYLAKMNATKFLFAAGAGANPSRVRGVISQALQEFTLSDSMKGVA